MAFSPGELQSEDVDAVLADANVQSSEYFAEPESPFRAEKGARKVGVRDQGPENNDEDWRGALYDSGVGVEVRKEEKVGLRW